MVLLLADDRKDIVQGIAHAVDWAARDVTVLCAYNGQEALRLIETNPVDLVITDICMPLMDGLELVRRAVQVAPQIRFVILTAYEEFSYAREAIRLGVVEYLTKPVRLEEIEKLVEKNQRRLQQERQEQQEKEKLMRQVQSTLPVLQERYFQALLAHPQLESAEIQQKFEEYNINLSTRNIVVVLLEIDQYHSLVKELPTGEMQTYYYAIANIWNDLLGPEYQFEKFNRGNGRLALLLNYSEKKSRLVVQYELYEKVKELQNYIKTFFDISISAGIGDCYAEIQSVAKSCRNAENALSHKLYYGDGCAMSTVNLRQEKSGGEEYPTELEQQLIGCVKQGAAELANEKTEQLFEVLCGMRSDNPMEVKDQLLHFILRLFYECSVCGDANILDILKEYQQFKTLDEIMHFLQKHIQRLAHQTAELSSDIKANILRVKRYIDEHYAETITLKKMSEYIYVSQPYLSYMFKEVVGQNFNEYLTFVRIEHAKELLLHHGSRVYEICEQVGYHDKKHFTSLFKKHTGQLPKEWAMQRQRELGSSSHGTLEEKNLQDSPH